MAKKKKKNKGPKDLVLAEVVIRRVLDRDGQSFTSVRVRDFVTGEMPEYQETLGMIAVANHTVDDLYAAYDDECDD